MNELRIEFTKAQDGATILRCVRADGTSTWQKKTGAHAAFFPLHDLVHFAVEVELGFTRGFYGLIAEGWDIADTDGKGARGSLPAESLIVEHVVSLLALETISGQVATPSDFDAALAASCTQSGIDPPRAFSAAELGRVRRAFGDLIARFKSLPFGETLTVSFRPTREA